MWLYPDNHHYIHKYYDTSIASTLAYFVRMGGTLSLFTKSCHKSDLILFKVCKNIKLDFQFFKFFFSIFHHEDLFIPEQFTVKAHPALFEGRGGAKKWGTVIPVYSWHTLSKRAQNTPKTAKARTLCVY